MGITAQGVETIWRKQENHLRQTLAVLKNLFRISRGEDRAWISEEHEQYDWRTCPKITEFKEMLERRTGLEVIMWDERLTTVEANRTLMEASVRRENRKQYLDQLAAVFILQGYLDSLSC